MYDCWQIMTVAYNTPQFSVVLLLEVRVKISAQLPSSQGLQMKKAIMASELPVNNCSSRVTIDIAAQSINQSIIV